MGHMLRKYTSNRGSALFMVISTMSALLISCMAMYFSMISARSSQNTVFNQMQASQSAQSIADIVRNSIADPDNADTGGGILRQTMLELNEGESISTGNNGFKSLDPNIATELDKNQIGAYSVTITCLKKTKVNGLLNMDFDIMVMTSVDGSRDVIHLRYNYRESGGGGEDGSGGDAELFAATGYIPHDAYINGGWYLTDVFYDTQYTYMSYFGGSGVNRIGQSLRTGGDLMIGGNSFAALNEKAKDDAISKAGVDQIGPVIWAVRGNFYLFNNVPINVRGDSQIFVGGDFIVDCDFIFQVDNALNAGGTYSGVSDHVCVYVNGDFNLNGRILKKNIWLFVNGNVTGIGGAESGTKLFVTDDATIGSIPGSLTPQPWPKDHSSSLSEAEHKAYDTANGYSYNEAMEILGRETATIAYYKWDLSANTESAPKIDIRLNATNQPWTDTDGNTFEPYQATYVIAYDENVPSASLIQGHGGNELGVIGNAFEINSVQTHTDNNTMSEVILIDTGDDPTNIMTIKLSDVTGHGEFAWFVDRQYWPADGFYPSTGSPNRGFPNGGSDAKNKGNRMVLLRGRGTVLLDLPAGVTYEDASYMLTAHAGWFLLAGGQTEMANLGGKEHITFFGIKYDANDISKRAVEYVHKTCDNTKDGCGTPTESESDAVCMECGGKLTKVTCAKHGDVNKYCKHCYPENEKRTDWCKNHVDNKKFDTFYNSLTGDNKKLVTGNDNKVVYPNTNYMLVSCEESADMRFSVQKYTGATIRNNAMFGFIYAPYMSYLSADGGEQGGTLRLFGGLTVGDYDLNGMYSYVGCYPDKMPQELAGMPGGGSMSGGALTGTGKSWKFEIGGYR